MRKIWAFSAILIALAAQSALAETVTVRESGSFRADHPALHAADGNGSTYASPAEGLGYVELAFELSSEALLGSVSAELALPDGAAVWVEYPAGGRRHRAPGSLRFGASGKIRFDLARQRAAADRFFLCLAGEGLERARIHEVSAAPIRPAALPRPLKLSVKSASSNSSLTMNERNLVDGPAGTVWTLDEPYDPDYSPLLEDYFNLPRESAAPNSGYADIAVEEPVRRGTVSVYFERIDRSPANASAVFALMMQRGDAEWEILDGSQFRYLRSGWNDYPLPEGEPLSALRLFFQYYDDFDVRVGEVEVWAEKTPSAHYEIPLQRFSAAAASPSDAFFDSRQLSGGRHFLEVLHAKDSEAAPYRLNGVELMREAHSNGEGQVSVRYRLPSSLVLEGINVLSSSPEARIHGLSIFGGDPRPHAAAGAVNGEGLTVPSGPLHLRGAAVFHSESDAPRGFHQVVGGRRLPVAPKAAAEGFTWLELDPNAEALAFSGSAAAVEFRGSDRARGPLEARLFDPDSPEGFAGLTDSVSASVSVNGHALWKRGNVFWRSRRDPPSSSAPPNLHEIIFEWTNRLPWDHWPAWMRRMAQPEGRTAPEGEGDPPVELLVVQASDADRGSSVRLFPRLPGAFGSELIIDQGDSLLSTDRESFRITGEVVGSASDLRIGGRAVPISGGRFSASVDLGEGLNSLAAVLRDDRGAIRARRILRIYRYREALKLRVERLRDGQTVFEPSIRVQGILEGGFPASVTVNGELSELHGSSFISPAIPLNAERTELRIEARDLFGRRAAVSITLLKDLRPPEIRITAPPAESWTARRMLRVSGVATDKFLRRVSVNGVSAQIEGGGFHALIPVAEGVNAVTAAAEDWGGNRAEAPAVGINVDRTPPEEFAISADVSGWTNNRRPTLEFQTSDAGVGMGRYEVSIGGRAFAGQVSPYRLPFLDEGKNTVVVRAIDQLGNSRDASIVLMIDTVPPDEPSDFRVIPGNGSAVLKWNERDDETQSYAITKGGDEDPGAKKSVPRSSGVEGEGDVEGTLYFEYIEEDLSNGETIGYSIRAVDRAGNVGPSVSAEATAGMAAAEHRADEPMLVEYRDVNLIIPAQSLDDGIGRVVVTEVSSDVLTEKSINPIISPIFEFSAVRENAKISEREHHTTLEKPYIAMLSYDEENVPEGFPEERLGVYYFNPEWGRWFREESAGVDVENNRIIFSTDHFSFFSVQSTVVNDISPQELSEIEYSPFSQSTQHAPVSVSAGGGTVSTSMTEFVLPGRDGFDFELRRIYDTGTARMDGSSFALNFSLGLSLAGSAKDLVIALAKMAAGTAAGVVAQHENAIKKYFQNNGDFSYAVGHGWRLNLPYIRGSNGGVLVRTPTGSFYDIFAMDKVNVTDHAAYRTLVFENHQHEDFTLEVDQARFDVNFASLLAGKPSIPGWALLSAKMTMADGSRYSFDGLGRLTQMVSGDGRNRIEVRYNGLLLDRIVDSMGRIIRFGYDSDIAQAATVGPQISRIWIENDPLEREVRYTYGPPGDVDAEVTLPLLKEAVDIGERQWDYDYDAHFLAATDFSFKVNFLSLLLTIVTGGAANEILSLLGLSTFTIAGGFQSEWLFVMDKAEGPGIGLNHLSYHKHTLTYVKLELTDFILGFIPTALKTSFRVQQRLAARQHTYTDPILNKSRIRSYSFSYGYTGQGNQFATTRSTVTDDLVREEHYFGTITKSYTRFLSWSDVVLGGGLQLVQPKAFYQNRKVKIPVEIRVETFDSSSGELLRTRTTAYNTRNLRPSQTTLSHPGGGSRTTRYGYDGWGNIAYQKDESSLEGASYLAETWMYYNGSSPQAAVSWPDSPLGPQPSISRGIRDRLLGRAVSYSVNGPAGPLAPKTQFAYYGYDASGERIREAEMVSRKWSVTKYGYDSSTGALSKIVNPLGAVTDLVWNYDAPGGTYTRTTISRSVTDVDGKSRDIRTVEAYEDTFGDLLWEKDGRGYTTEYGYDALGRKTMIRLPDEGDRKHWVPDSGRLPAWRRDNPTTRIRYDDSKLTVSVTDVLGASSFYGFAHNGKPISGRASNRYGYDVQGRPVSAPVEALRLWSYDAYGRMTGFTDRNGLKTDFVYDALNRRTAEIHHMGGGKTTRRRWEYADGGRSHTLIDEVGNKVVELYDVEDRLLSTASYSPEGRAAFRESYSYDALGNRIGTTDGEGHGTVTEYDERGMRTRVVRPEAQYYDGAGLQTAAAYTRYEYDAAGGLIAEYASSRRGEDEKTYRRDQLGRMILETVKVREADGVRSHSTRYHYDENGNEILVEDPLGNKTRSVHSPRNLKLRVVDAGGRTVSYGYDAKDRRISATDQRGNSERYGDRFTIDLSYDDFDRLILGRLPPMSETAPRGTVRLAYDKRGNLLARFDPDGSRTVYSYTPRHWKASETLIGARLDGSAASYATSYRYDDAGRMIEMREPGGAVTRTEYDGAGRRAKETLPDGSIKRYGWNLRGQPAFESDDHGNRILYRYDELGRQSSLTDQEEQTSFHYYDLRGNPARTVDPAGESFSTLYDERGLASEESDSRGMRKRYAYDAAGRLTRLTDARGVTATYTYTPTGLVASIAYAKGDESHLQRFSYDEAGALREVSDNGTVTRYNERDGVYTPNPFNLTFRIEESAGGKTLANEYGWDLMQRMVSVKYSGGESMRFLYNTLGQLERIPEIIEEPMSFDANGLLTGYRFAGKASSGFRYDGKRRVTAITHRDAAGEASRTHKLVYDSVDGIIQMNDDHFSYDRAGRIKSAVLGGKNAAEEYELDADEFALGSVRSDVRGEKAVAIPSSDLTLDWGAGSLGMDLGYAYKVKRILFRPKDPKSRLDPERIRVAASLYNREGLYAERRFAMERDERDGTVTITLEPPAFVRFVKIRSHINPLDRDGEPIKRSGVFDADPDSVEVFALTAGKNVFYAYAADGDRDKLAILSNAMKVKRYSYYPKSDLVRIAEGYAYRYDGNGSLIEKGNVFAESGGELEIKAEGDYLRYEYDLLNRLVKVSRLDPDSGRVEVKATYGYNHRNLRILRTDSEGTIRYVYDLEGNVLEEHRGDEVTRYVYRRGRHLAKLSGGRTYYYGTDHLGTTTVMFDGRGDAVWKGETSPFGNDAATTGSLDETVRFTGKEFDEAAGLYYFNARWYDASLGRFTSEDPARDGVNWYVYVGNRPLGAVDPTGMISFSPIKDLIFAFADQSNSGIDAILGALYGDKGSQAMVKQAAENVAVDVLRDGADAAELVSDGAGIVALGATATGALPVAGGAMGVAKGADFAALGMNIAADAIQGEFSADTFAGAVNLGVGFSLGRVLPKYNIGSKRFHNLIGSNRGRFVTDNVGKATQIFSVVASKTASMAAKGLAYDSIDD